MAGAHYPGLFSSTQFLYNKLQHALVQEQTKTNVPYVTNGLILVTMSFTESQATLFRIYQVG